jgi:hypothetical protein
MIWSRVMGDACNGGNVELVMTSHLTNALEANNIAKKSAKNMGIYLQW